ncbi:nucleoside-binding protein [Stackebrandtia endophytica]|uniref:Nucleoside-binding protein n=2 Tax=Stackebrandtia endophytica TaxID=1496996 RepID=A0A543ATW5_9ACTN|nr:nucleoside-binding protein [Stackebrandtia endophytica]
MRSMRGKRMAAIGVTCGLALFVTACGEAPDSDSGNEAVAKDFKACMVTDTGGVEDRSFNASAWQGMNAAVEAEPAVEVAVKESQTEADYETNLVGFINEGCDLIVAVGGLMGEALTTVATDYPDQRFAIVDANLSDLPNVYSMEFNAAQSSFLAGYLAAGTSETGKVATYGGLNIPPVTIFMDGFAEGVDYYNEKNDADVAVLGWNHKSQDGSFAESFEDAAKGKSLTENFVSQGADVIFPVAGKTGLGTPTVTQTDDSLSSIWVDLDGCESASEYCEEFLTTSEKNIPDAVSAAILSARDGGPKDGHSIGTLENGGVSLAALRADVDADLAAEIEEVKAAIIAGDITIESIAQPKE